MEKNKLHVFMVVTSFSPLPMGGSERQAFALARELKGIGHDISIFCFGNKSSMRHETVDGIHIYRMRMSFWLSDLLAGKKKKSAPVRIEFENNKPDNFKITGKKSVFSFISYFLFLAECASVIRKHRLKADIIYVPIMEWTAFIGARLGARCNAKVVIKDSTVNGITNLLRYPFGKSMQRYIARKCYFVAMTEAIKNNLLSAGIHENRIEKIPNGILMGSDVPPRTNRNQFLFVGNLYQQPAKGVDTLLKAWKLAVPGIRDGKLLIVGDGNTKEYYDYVSSQGISESVSFLGKQSDVKQWMNTSFAFVLPSRREGMSNALLEAMASGMPCIATDISGNQDLIKNGENGFLVPPENEELLADALIRVYNDPQKAEQMGKNAQRTVEKEFSMGVIAKKYNQYFYHLSGS